MINQNEIEEAAKKHDDETNIHDGYHDFKSGANWAIEKLKERSGKGFNEWQKDYIGDRLFHNGNTRWQMDAWQAATIAAEARHSEEKKKLEDRIEKLREAIYLRGVDLRDTKTVHKRLTEALALDEQLKEGKV